MTRHKLLAANIKLQIGLSASVRPTGDSEVSDPMAREGGRGRKRFSRYLWHCGAASNERRVCADGRTDADEGDGRGLGLGATGRQAAHRQRGGRRSQNVIAPFWTGMKSAPREDCDCSGGMGRDGWVVGWPVSGHAFFLVTPHKLSFTVPSWRLQSGLLFCNL